MTLQLRIFPPIILNLKCKKCAKCKKHAWEATPHAECGVDLIIGVLGEKPSLSLLMVLPYVYTE